MSNKSLKPVTYGVVLIVAIYGASIGRTFAQVDPYEHYKQWWPSYAKVETARWAIPCVATGALIGVLVGFALDKTIGKYIPFWLLLAAVISLVPLWYFEIILFPAQPPP